MLLEASMIRLLVLTIVAYSTCVSASLPGLALKCLAKQAALYQKMPASCQALIHRYQQEALRAETNYLRTLTPLAQSHYASFRAALLAGDFKCPALKFHRGQDYRSIEQMRTDTNHRPDIEQETHLYLKTLSLDNILHVVSSSNQRSPFWASILCHTIGIPADTHYPLEWCRFSILHEIAHQLNQDCLPAPGLPIVETYFDFRRAREVHADIWAALLGGEHVTQAGIEWLSQLPSHCGPTHPEPSIRIIHLNAALAALRQGIN